MAASSDMFDIVKARLLYQGNTPLSAPRDCEVSAEDVLRNAKDLANSDLGLSLKAEEEGDWVFECDEVDLVFGEGPLGVGVFMHKDYTPLVVITKVGGQADTARALVGDQIIKVDGELITSDKPLNSVEVFKSLVAQHDHSEPLIITVNRYRVHKAKQVEVELFFTDGALGIDVEDRNNKVIVVKLSEQAEVNGTILSDEIVRVNKENVKSEEHFKEIMAAQDEKEPLTLTVCRWIDMGTAPSSLTLPLISHSIVSPVMLSKEDDTSSISSSQSSQSRVRQFPMMAPAAGSDPSQPEQSDKVFVHFSIELFDCQPKTISSEKNVRLLTSHLRRRLRLSHGEVVITNVEKSMEGTSGGVSSLDNGCVVSCRIDGIRDQEHGEALMGMISASTIGVSPPMISEDLIGRSFVLGDTIRLCLTEQESLALQSQGLQSSLNNEYGEGYNGVELKQDSEEEEEEEEEDDDDDDDDGDGEGEDEVSEKNQEEGKDLLNSASVGPRSHQRYQFDGVPPPSSNPNTTHPSSAAPVTSPLTSSSNHRHHTSVRNEHHSLHRGQTPHSSLSLNTELLDVVRMEVKHAVKDAFSHLVRDDAERLELLKYQEMAKEENVTSKPQLAAKFIGLTENLFQFRCDLASELDIMARDLQKLTLLGEAVSKFKVDTEHVAAVERQNEINLAKEKAERARENEELRLKLEKMELALKNSEEEANRWRNQALASLKSPNRSGESNNGGGSIHTVPSMSSKEAENTCQISLFNLSQPTSGRELRGLLKEVDEEVKLLLATCSKKCKWVDDSMSQERERSHDLSGGGAGGGGYSLNSMFSEYSILTKKEIKEWQDVREAIAQASRLLVMVEREEKKGGGVISQSEQQQRLQNYLQIGEALDQFQQLLAEWRNQKDGLEEHTSNIDHKILGELLKKAMASNYSRLFQLKDGVALFKTQLELLQPPPLISLL